MVFRLAALELYKRLIPSILIQQGRLVKGKQYADYRDAGGAATTARAHNAQGADEIIVCDIEASKLGIEPDFETLRQIAEECFMPLTFFGGINSEDRAKKAMDNGADKIGMTTAVFDNSEIISTLSRRYGNQAIVLGLDIMKDSAGQYRLFDHRTHQLRDENPIDFTKKCIDLGVGEVRIMAVHLEGTNQGFDLDLYQEIETNVNVPIILEGGSGSLHDIENAYSRGVSAVAVGNMLVFSDANLVKIKQHMRTKMIHARP